MKDKARKSSYRTAIKRTKPSAPVAWLESKNLLEGRILDYGSGRGFDADYLGATKYDPHYCPELPSGKFDTIICVYVLNVVTKADEKKILDEIQSYLEEGGRAYVAVRRDVIKDGLTAAGTYQRDVQLSTVPIVEVRGKFAIYKVEK